VLDVVQVSAAGMELSALKADFGARLTFCGTLCVQTTLLQGTPEDVRREVLWRRKLFADGGLVLAPTNTIVPGTPLANVWSSTAPPGAWRGEACALPALPLTAPGSVSKFK